MLYGFSPMHPGEFLREEVLPGLGVTKTELARRLNVSVESLDALLEERASVTPSIAYALGKVCGNDDAEVWLTLQNRYDLYWIERADHGASRDGAL